MIIDVNASLGHYPFRPLRQNTAAELAALLARSGISRALVTSIHAVFYRDAHRGNEELWAETAPHAGRLIPVATINPAYVGWERDLAEALDIWKSPAIALMPEHHGYTLADARGQAVLAQLERRQVPVLLRQRWEDRRQRHAFDRAEDLTPAALFDAAKAFPRLRFLLVNWAGLDGARMVAAGLKGRVLLDFARLQVVNRKEVPALLETLGPEALAFGSHLPFEYVSGSLIKLANVQLRHPEAYAAIAGGNAARFLGLR